MYIVVILGEVLPVVGTIALLGLWVYQQIGVERRTSELQSLSAALGVFQTYQSNNAMFNAIYELNKDKAFSERIRTLQLFNYQLGLAAIEEVLPDSDKADIPEAIRAYDSTPDIEAKMERNQERLEKLQDRRDAREEKIRRSAEAAKRKYLSLYIGLSLISIVGAVCKVLCTLR